MGTNSNNTLLAGVLGDAKLGTFTSLEITKKGDIRGRGVDKKQYGNDRVRVVILTGFKYDTLLERSLSALDEKGVDAFVEEALAKGLTGWESPPKPEPLTKKDIELCKEAAALRVIDTFFRDFGLDSPFEEQPMLDEHDTNIEMAPGSEKYEERAEAMRKIKKAQDEAVRKLKAAAKAPKGKVEVPVTREHVVEAFNKVRESIERSLAGENESTTDHVFETLTVDGVEVRGVRVYHPAEGTEPAAPDGTIYLQGLKIAETVIEPAPNGHWDTQSNPVTVARNFIEAQLPKGRYVQYKLDPASSDWKLHAGGTLPVLAKNAGVTFDRKAIEATLRKAV